MVFNAAADPWLVETSIERWKVRIPRIAKTCTDITLTQRRFDFIYEYIQAQMFDREAYLCLQAAAGYELRYRPNQDRVRGFGPGDGRTPIDDFTDLQGGSYLTHT